MVTTAQKIYILILFGVASGISLHSGYTLPFQWEHFYVFLAYCFFVVLYTHRSVIVNLSGNQNLMMSMGFALSLALITNIFWAFLLELVVELYMYIYEKFQKKNPQAFWEFLYNCSSAIVPVFFVLLFFSPYLNQNDYNFNLIFILFLVVVLNSIASKILFIILMFLGKSINSVSYVIKLFTNNQMIHGSIITAIMHSYLFYFYIKQEYLLMASFFLLNLMIVESYRSVIKSANTQMERDLFKELAYKDQLTGAYNRRYLDLEITELSKTKENLGLVITDIDKFKSINDGYNHAVGDQVLIHYVKTIQQLLPEGDIFARTGGEEFTMILRNKNPQACLEVIENVRKTIEKSIIPVDFNGQPTEINHTSSFGLYFYNCTIDPISIHEGINEADNLLYQSKQNGRNRITTNFESKTYPLT